LACCVGEGMNKELVNKLRLDAGIARDSYDHTLVALNKEGETIDPLEGLEIFAELIVRECAKVLRDSSYKHSHTDYYEGFNEALNYSAFRIEELFGVESEEERFDDTP